MGQGGLLRKFVRYTLIVIGSGCTLFVILGIIAVATTDVREESPVVPEPEAPSTEQAPDPWVRPLESPGTKWPEPADAAYRKAEPEPDPTPEPTSSNSSSDPIRSNATVTESGYLALPNNNCGQILGKNPDDVSRARLICSSILNIAQVERVQAAGDRFDVWVGAGLATDLLTGMEDSEYFVKRLMKYWRRQVDSESVTVGVYFGTAEIAKGITTPQGDVVSLWE